MPELQSNPASEQSPLEPSPSPPTSTVSSAIVSPYAKSSNSNGTPFPIESLVAGHQAHNVHLHHQQQQQHTLEATSHQHLTSLPLAAVSAHENANFGLISSGGPHASSNLNARSYYFLPQ